MKRLVDELDHRMLLNEKDPLEIRAFQYDIVCNGYELSSGAIRNHDSETMCRAFEIAGGDHSFHMLKSAGRSDDEVLGEVAQKVSSWIKTQFRGGS